MQVLLDTLGSREPMLVTLQPVRVCARVYIVCLVFVPVFVCMGLRVNWHGTLAKEMLQPSSGNY